MVKSDHTFNQKRFKGCSGRFGIRFKFVGADIRIERPEQY